MVENKQPRIVEEGRLLPNSTYVVEFNENLTISQMEKYIRWLELLAGNGIRFVPSTKRVKIVKENRNE